MRMRRQTRLERLKHKISLAAFAHNHKGIFGPFGLLHSATAGLFGHATFRYCEAIFKVPIPL